MPAFKDLTGMRFGRLLVIDRGPNIERTLRGMTGTRTSTSVRWNCLCDCGGTVLVRSNGLMTGNTRSCGCLAKEVQSRSGKLRRVHGETHTPTFVSWRSMLTRCTNPNDPYYADYGGRGIRVCERWRDSYECFRVDMGYRPSLEYSLDRFPDTNGNYEPGNCRWATAFEQARNRRSSRKVTFNGETLCVSEWASRLGITTEAVLHRLNVGWPLELALTASPNTCFPRGRGRPKKIA